MKQKYGIFFISLSLSVAKADGINDHANSIPLSDPAILYSTAGAPSNSTLVRYLQGDTQIEPSQIGQFPAAHLRTMDNILRKDFEDLWSDKSLFKLNSKKAFENVNPLGEMCTNFREMSEQKRREVLIKVLYALSFSEARLRTHDEAGKRINGGESNPKELALGFFQLSLDLKNKPGLKGQCNFSKQQDLIDDVSQNIRCVLSQMQLRQKYDRPIYGSRKDVFKVKTWVPRIRWKKGGFYYDQKMTALYTSNLQNDRKDQMMQNKMLPSFHRLEPDCNIALKYNTKAKAVNGVSLNVLSPDVGLRVKDRVAALDD